MPFTAEELEAMRVADAEIEREFETSRSAQHEAAAKRRAYRARKKNAAPDNCSVRSGT